MLMLIDEVVTLMGRKYDKKNRRFNTKPSDISKGKTINLGTPKSVADKLTILHMTAALLGVSGDQKICQLRI